MNKNIYLVTDDRENLLEIVEEYAKLKIGFIQYRDKNIDDFNYVKKANQIYRIANKYKVQFIVNDRTHLLDLIKCDGFHVGQDDGQHKLLRQKYPNLHMGISVHSKNNAVKAIKNGANLLGVGTMFASRTKKDGKRVSVKELKKIRKLTNEIAIIGGLNENNIQKVPRNLYKYVAISSYLIDSKNPKATLLKLQKVING